MLAVTGPLPAGPGWAYEFKWDGVRAIAQLSGGRARLYARSGTEITIGYPELAGLGTAVRDAVLDGEIVTIDQAGHPSFTLLAERIHVRDAGRAAAFAATRPVTYMIFDVLRLDGGDLTGHTYAERRGVLDALGLSGRHWLTPPMFADGAATTAAAGEHGLEGVMAKRLDSVYRPGRRSGDWVKFKIDQTEEFVVGGWRPGKRSLGALLVGVPGKEGLIYRGRVGGGISADAEKSLLTALAALSAKQSPFAGTALSREEVKGVSWVRPELVVEVRYGQQTPDGRLRFPRFLRVRPDLTPGDVASEGERHGDGDETHGGGDEARDG